MKDIIIITGASSGFGASKIVPMRAEGTDKEVSDLLDRPLQRKGLEQSRKSLTLWRPRRSPRVQNFDGL